MKFSLIALAALSLHALFATAGNASPIVYNQPSVFPGSYSSYTSDRDAGGNGFRTWDNFTLSQTTQIDGVNWQGFYLNFITPAGNPAAPDTTSWEISFWSNVAGQPGLLLQSQTISAASVTSTLAGFTAFNLPPSVTVALRNFEATLTSTFQAQAGTTYWLSVLSNSPTFNPVFSWYQGSGGNGVSVQSQLASGSKVDVATDRQFSLEGQVVVPEPSTVVVFFLAAVALVLFGWRQVFKRPKALVLTACVLAVLLGNTFPVSADVIVTPASSTLGEGTPTTDALQHEP